MLATVAVIYWEDALLTERLTVPAHQAEAGHYTFAYGDEGNGGTSKSTIDANRPLSWSCALTRMYEFPYCGFGFSLTPRVGEGIDLSGYDTVRFRLDHEGPGRLMRIYLKNHNALYSREGIPQTDKYNVLDTAVINGRQEITIQLANFTVAEWWKAQFGIPPELAMPEFKNVVTFELQNGLDGRPGDYKTSISNIVFEKRALSAREIYAALAVAWLGLLAGILWHNRKQAAKRQQAEAEQLRWASEHDALTNLPNRRAFQWRLRAAALRSMDHGTSLALLLIDLDHFKHINDSLGHAAGDELLRSMAERLKKSVRACDFVSRIGGDEFAVIMEHIEGEPEALARGNQLLTQLLSPTRVAGRLIRPGASIGGALFPEHAKSGDDLFKAADTALYALKDEGRGGTKMFHPLLLQTAERAGAQLDAARTAVSEKSVVPYYQPKIDLVTGEVVGFEALLRCGSRTQLQLPGAMEEAFKDYELAAKLGELMQRQVAQDISSWLNDGFNVGTIAINASPAEFLRGDYADRLLDLMHLYDVPPYLIEIEVTEQVFLGRSAELVAHSLVSLKNAGVRLALDDFGTGYSSLSHLRDLSVDTVKIDRSFVKCITNCEESAAIVSAIVSLSRTLKLGVVAEGVETRAQSDLLRVLGCPHGQGYLFGAAASGEDLTVMLRKRSLAA